MADRDNLRPMKPDIYTKAVLAVIACALASLAINQYINPKTAAQAQSSGLQFGVGDCNGFVYTFDQRSGTVSRYRCISGAPEGKITVH